MNKLVLINAPGGSVSMPYLALPLIVSYIKSKGINDVRQYDFNIELTDYFISNNGMKKLKGSINKVYESDYDVEYNKIICESLSVLLDNVKGKCKNEQVLSNHYWHVAAVLGQAYNIFNQLGVNYDKLNSSELSLKEYLKLDSIVTQWISSNLDNVIKENNPSFIGISIPFPEQRLYGVYIACYLKKFYPDIKVIVGGGYISEYFEREQDKTDLLDLFDYIIIGEGYDSIMDIVSGKSNNKNVIRADKKLYKSPKLMPLPEFFTADLEKYITPRLVLPIYPSRGCYWGKCSFCNINKVETHFTQKSVDSIFRDMVILSDRYKCYDFYFSSDAMLIGTLVGLSRKISENNYKFKWECEVRFEKKLNEEEFKILSQGGCSLLRFGLESGSQAVLNNMNKGINIEEASNILRLANRYGIKTAVYIIIGYPGESLEDINLTKQFLENNKNYIDYAGIHKYQLITGSPMYENPSKYCNLIYDEKGMLSYKCEFTDAELDKTIEGIKYDLKDSIDFSYIPSGGIPTTNKVEFDKYETDDYISDAEWLVKSKATNDVKSLDIKKGENIITHLPTGTILKE